MTILYNACLDENAVTQVDEELHSDGVPGDMAASGDVDALL
jgi:hypothetical protein